MKKTLLTIILFLLTISCFSQIKILTNNKLIINHGDIVLYLTSDTCTLVSKHTLKYSDFLKLDSDRDNKWFQDTYFGKYNKNKYLYSGYDLGHLTPSHITSYNDTVNHNSFSLFNQAPQIATFNRGKWARLEASIEDTIAKYKTDVEIVTGVIYDPSNKEYLGKSRIPIPISYFKVLVIKNKSYVWLGSNINANIITIKLSELNKLFKLNKMNLVISK